MFIFNFFCKSGHNSTNFLETLLSALNSVTAHSSILPSTEPTPTTAKPMIIKPQHEMAILSYKKEYHTKNDLNIFNDLSILCSVFLQCLIFIFNLCFILYVLVCASSVLSSVYKYEDLYCQR